METTTEVRKEVGSVAGVSHTCSSEENYAERDAIGKCAVTVATEKLFLVSLWMAQLQPKDILRILCKPKSMDGQRLVVNYASSEHGRKRYRTETYERKRRVLTRLAEVIVAGCKT